MSSRCGKLFGVIARHPVMAVLVLTWGLVGVGVLVGADGDGNAEQMARSLAELRAEVETLSAEIETRKEEMKAQARSVAMRKAELETEIQREELRLKAVGELAAQRKARLNADREAADALLPTLKAAIAHVRAAVAESLPFRREERLAELDRLLARLDDGSLRAQDAVARVWERAEDEFRLASECTLDRAVIRLDGREVLAEVVRLGTVALFFKAPDGRFGVMRRGPEGYGLHVFARREDEAAVAMVFDAFRKQMRQGFHVVPDATPVAPAAGGTR